MTAIISFHLVIFHLNGVCTKSTHTHNPKQKMDSDCTICFHVTCYQAELRRVENIIKLSMVGIFYSFLQGLVFYVIMASSEASSRREPQHTWTSNINSFEASQQALTPFSHFNDLYLIKNNLHAQYQFPYNQRHLSQHIPSYSIPPLHFHSDVK